MKLTSLPSIVLIVSALTASAIGVMEDKLLRYAQHQSTRNVQQPKPDGDAAAPRDINDEADPRRDHLPSSSNMDDHLWQDARRSTLIVQQPLPDGDDESQFLKSTVAASMNTSFYASGLRLPSGQESKAAIAIATNNVTTIKTNVFDKYKDTATKAVVATAKTKASKEPRAQKGSKAPVYTKGSKAVSKSSDDEDCRGAKAKSGKTCNPSSEPSTNPSEQPSLDPSSNPSEKPSLDPSSNPSEKPSLDPSSNPSEHPSSSAKPSSKQYILKGTYSSGTISVAVPDNTAAGVTDSIGVTPPVGAVITNLRVKINLTHTWIGDMVINLKAPNGKVLNLFNQHGGSIAYPWTCGGENLLNTVISSEGTTAFRSGSESCVDAPFTGTFKATAATNVGPTGYVSNAASFAELYTIPSGTWTLAMRDYESNIGTLTSWEIEFF